MPLFSCGINHQSAPINIREKLAFNVHQTKAALQDLCRMEAVNEAVLLSTCNRTEIYIAGENPSGLQQWLKQRSSSAKVNIDQYSYFYKNNEAVRHLLRVSSGLDSMVLGEPEIFGQVKQAYRLACEVGAAGQQLQHLFPAAFAASKMIRHETQIGFNPISIAYAAVQIAKRIFTDLSNCRILLIGAGELMELMVTHWRQQGIKQIMIANRTEEKARLLAELAQGSAISFGEIPIHLNQADIVITATASQLPIIGKGMIERTLKIRKRRPMLMVDLAVPRDIEPEVNQLEDIYLYNIDDLQEIINANLKNRRESAQQAEALAELQAAHYMRQLEISQISDIITQFRQEAEQYRDQSTQKALLDLNQGRDAQQVIIQLSHQLTNKILHNPTVKLRQFAYHQQADALILAKQLLTSEEN